jgi:LysM repeat protein
MPDVGNVLAVLAVLVTWAALPAARPAQAQQQRDGGAQRQQEQDQQVRGQRVQLSLRYEALRDAYVGAVYDDGTFYLSLSDLFDRLHLDYQVQPQDSTASGFYLSEDRKYRIDFRAEKAFVGDAGHTFSAGAFRLSELDAFLRPSLYEKLFGWTLEPNMRGLSVRLDAPEALPVDRARQRAAARRSMERLQVARTPAPLLAGRRRRLLGGGVLDYALGATTSERGSSASYTLRGGGEVLGGAVRGQLSGSFATDRDASVRTGDVRWRYVPAPNDYVSQVEVGMLSSSGLEPFSYYGAHVSNQPVRQRHLFGFYDVQGENEPGNEVELYVDGRLAAYEEVGELGRYRFEIPLSYGTTPVTVRTYGPTGSYQERQFRLQVPSTFVPEGEVYYDLDVGRTESFYDAALSGDVAGEQPAGEAPGAQREDAYTLGQASAAVGLTPWLTSKTGVEYVGDIDTRPDRQPVRAYNTLSARWRSYIASVRVAPSVSYRAALSAYFPSLASFQVSYEHFDEAPLYQAPRRQSELRVQANVPVEYRGLPLYARLTGRRVGRTSGEVAYRLFPSLTARLGGRLRGTLEYEGAARRTLGVPGLAPVRLGTSRLTTRWTYNLPRFEGTLGWLGGTTLSAEAGYDTERGRVGRMNLNLSRAVPGGGRLRLSVDHSAVTDATRAQARLTLRLPYMRSTTTARAGGQQRSVTQAVSGAVGYDRARDDVVLEERSMVGQAAASVRPFLDYDGDNTFDPESERIIEDARVRFQRATATRQTEAGLTRANNLLAYERYNLYVDQSTVKNPLWTPKADTFSVVAEPNRFKPVDVPFYVGGVVQGSVLEQQRDGSTRPVSGLKLKLRSADGDYTKTLPVFSDGSFYKMGVPPGTYTARVDSSQLSVLQVRSDPPMRRFEVEATKQGDFVENVDFVLKSRGTTPSAQPDSSSTSQRASEPASAPSQPPATGSASAADSASTVGAVADSSSVSGQAATETSGDNAPKEPYVVQAGNTLTGIAWSVYENGWLWPKIWRANRAALGDPDLIYPGQRLRIPAKPP